MALHRYSLAPTGAGSHSPQLHARTQQAFSPALNDGPETSTTNQQPHRTQLKSELNLNYGDSTSSSHTHLPQATGSETMGNQKMMTPKKAPGRPRGSGGGRGRGCGGGATGGRSQSVTPGLGATADGPKRKLTLKLRLGTGTPEWNATPTPQYEQGEEHDDLSTLPEQITTRTGRTVRAPKHLDDTNWDPAFGGSDRPEDDEDEYRPCASYHAHGTPSVFTLPQQHQPPKKSGGRHRKNAQKQSMEQVDEEDAPSSPTIVGDQPMHEPDNSEVYAILNSLRSTSKTHLELPELSQAANPEKVQPYSAKFLIQLYLSCYRDKSWDLCDMIADTWIRAFHESRAYGQRNPANALWRPNTALERRKRKAIEYNKGLKKKHHIPSEFDTNPKDYGLLFADPDLEHDVTGIHTDLLNDLYNGTNKNCGARMLWADALALAGDKTEKILGDTKKKGYEVHTDVLFNIMQTSLRMMRRNLTLKIEESTEGAWCKRYHEHSKHKLPCYRQKAWKCGLGDDIDGEEQEGSQHQNGSVIDQVSQDLFAAFMQNEDEGQGEKRGYDDGEMSPSKRIRYANDVDAEGDSDED
jgi:hypothetical protein